MYVCMGFRFICMRMYEANIPRHFVCMYAYVCGIRVCDYVCMSMHT